MEMDKALALKALKLLDSKIAQAGIKKVTLTIGGGGSMILQHHYNGGTVDIDAVPLEIDMESLKPFVESVARELGISPDWINPYYQAFTIYLPEDSRNRMSVTFKGERLIVQSLGVEDILIMKLMAGRAKDKPHIMHLLKLSPDLKIVENRLEELTKMYPELAQRALDLFDDLTEASS